MSKPHITTSLNEYQVARAMLIIGDWNSVTRIAREMDKHREAVSYWLQQLRRNRRVEQRRNPAFPGYQWKLTEAGAAFANFTRPEDAEDSPSLIRHDHRALAAALGMTAYVIPPPGRVHRCDGGGWGGR